MLEEQDKQDQNDQGCHRWLCPERFPLDGFQFSQALLVLGRSQSDYVGVILRSGAEGVAFRRTVSVALYRLSQWRKELNQGDADEPLQQCLEIRLALAEAEPLNDRRQLDLMLALARSGEVTEARAIADKYLSRPNADTEMLMEIARAYAQCSLFASTEPERTSLLKSGFDAMKTAMQAGFSDSVFLHNELDLAPVRKVFPDQL